MLGWHKRNAREAFCLSLLLLPAMGCTGGNDAADRGGDSTDVPKTTFGSSRRIASGLYGSLLVDPWDDRTPVVIAFDYTNGDAVLAVRPLDGRLGCNAGAGFASKVFDKLQNRVQLIAFTSSSADGPVLKFIDHNCNQYGPTIPGAALPSMVYADPPAYLVAAKSNSEVTTQLFVVDPWNGTSNVLASNVAWYAVSSAEDSTLWMFDGGHYKVFDGKQRQLCDIGTAVTEIQYQKNSSGPFYLVDAGVLRRYQSITDPVPVQLAEDACQLTKDDSAIYYLSPCASRQLQRYEFNSRQVTVIDSGASELVSTQKIPGTTNAYVLYTKPGAQGGKDLWLFSPDAPKTLVVPGFNRLYDWSALPGFSIIALADSDGVKASLMRKDDSGTSVLLDGVSVEFTRGLLAKFDALTSSGDLFTLPTLSNPPQLVASSVPYVKSANTISLAASDEAAQYGAAVIANATGDVGELQLIRYPAMTSPGPESPLTIAQQSPVGKAQFFEAMPAIGYFANWTGSLADGQGSLFVREFTHGVVTNVSDAVREFKEVKWPSEAILYTTWDSDSAGIWIANAE